MLEPPAPLLDSSTGIFRSSRIPTGEIDDGAPWELIGLLWSLLASYVGSAFSLVSLSLTVPLGADVREHVATFARSAMLRAGEGALMVIDRRGNGAEHIHGIAIVAEPGSAHAAWCRLTGASAKCCKLTTITGWEEHVAGQRGDLFQNVAKVLGYAFKPWPAEYGRRRLREDAIACGVLAPVWERVLAALETRGAADEPISARPPCQRCGRPIPPGKRSHAMWCSPICRKAASRDRRRCESAAKTPPAGPRE